MPQLSERHRGEVDRLWEGEGAAMVNQDGNGNFVELYNKVS